MDWVKVKGNMAFNKAFIENVQVFYDKRGVVVRLWVHGVTEGFDKVFSDGESALKWVEKEFGVKLGVMV